NRLHRRLRGIVCCHQDHIRSGIDLHDPFEYVQAAQLRHDEVRKDNLRMALHAMSSPTSGSDAVRISRLGWAKALESISRLPKLSSMMSSVTMGFVASNIDRPSSSGGPFIVGPASPLSDWGEPLSVARNI